MSNRKNPRRPQSFRRDERPRMGCGPGCTVCYPSLRNERLERDSDYRNERDSRSPRWACGLVPDRTFPLLRDYLARLAAD